MKLNEFFITEDKRHIAFCFGRFQPPHLGHKLLIETTRDTAEGGDFHIYTSTSQDPKKNPLDFETKIKFMKAMFPEMVKEISDDISLNTIMKVAVSLYQKGYRSATFVAGQDQINTFSALLLKYNGINAAHGFYEFRPLNFVASNSPDVRATQVRDAAARGDFELFKKMTGTEGSLAKQIYEAVREGMDSVKLDELSTEKLAQYKKAAGSDASAADKKGDFKRGDKRFKGIVNATKKQFANDAKKPKEGLEDPKDNPCWKGYKPVGTKKKAGKTVPNCVPVSEEIQQEMNKCIELLEGRSKKPTKLAKNARHAIPNATNYPKLDSYYDLYRFGVAMAGQPEDNSPTRGPIGHSPSTIAYSDADSAIIKAAEKNVGIKGVKISKDGKKEMPNVYTTSPVPKRK